MTHDNKPKIALWHHHLGIGDLIWHIPYMRELAKHSKDNKITLITRPSTMPEALLVYEQCVGDIIIFDYKPRKTEYRTGIHDGKKGMDIFIKTLKNYHIDEIYIFSNRMRYAYMAKKAGIKKRAGYGFDIFQRMFLSKPPFLKREKVPGSRVYRDASRLMMAHGFIEQPVIPKLHVEEALNKDVMGEFGHLSKPWVAFSIGASEPEKRWPSEYFAKLARDLHEKYQATIFLLGGKGEKKIADSILSDGDHPPYMHAILDKSIIQSAALLKSCDFLIGNDTGALNLAAAVDTPSLGLFGATLPLEHDPILYAAEAKSMEKISPDEVLSLFNSLFQKR